MAAIVESIEIAGRPEDVFAKATDSSRFPEWQASVVSVRQEGTGPLAVGSRAVVTQAARSPDDAWNRGDHPTEASQELGVARGRRPGQRDSQRHG